MAKCKGNPDNLEGWTPPPVPDKTVWGICPDCGKDIISGETVWWMQDKKVCMDCHEPYLSAEIGHLDCCDLVLPGVSLEG
jgi:hypothetical protein